MECPFNWLFLGTYDIEVRYIGIDLEPIKLSIVFHA